MTEQTLAAPLPLATTDRASIRARQWIQSPGYDLAIFILSPLLGFYIFLLAPTGPSLVVSIIGSFLGIPHYLSTWSFYLWDANHEHHKTHWMTFVAGPIAIGAAIAGLMLAGYWDVLKFVLFFWNSFHVARQSCGLLSIYRHKAGVNGAVDKHVANTAIMTAAMFCTVWSVHLNKPVFQYIERVSPWFYGALRNGLLIATVATVLVLAVWLHLRIRRGAAPSFAETAFLVTSLVLFVPYLYAQDWNRAMFGILVGHFIQYLGIVWLVHRRKLTREPGGSVGQQALGFIAARLPLLALAAIVVGLGFWGAPRVFATVGLPYLLWEGFGIAVIAWHFYLDAFFWAFKSPHVRKTLGPWIARPA